MKVSYPVVAVSFAEKIIQTNFVQRFLQIFRDTQDIHRILAVIPLTLLVSHTLYMRSAPSVAMMTLNIDGPEMLWFILLGFPALFMALWALFSAEFQPKLYVRQAIFVIWAGLAHRWAYGLETLGTPYITAVSLAALTSYLPFAFWGLRPDQLFTKIRDDYQRQKKSKPPVIQVAPPAQKIESDAA